MGCCGFCSPRYKRLVNNVYPSNPIDGIVKSNLEKLKFYAKSSPEKLDRIGEYFAQRIARDLYRNRFEYVFMGMEAMEQILLTSKTQSLNLFVESFLRVIHQLLESQEPSIQLLATRAFVKFSNIEEDVPSYHRKYDFFVSKFSALCHNNASDLNTRKMLRLAGLNGLKGVIRKTVSDDLQVDIWDETHMDKIVPSLLYNLQDKEVIPGFSVPDSANASTPYDTAEECLRELMSKVTFGNIRSVLKPVLKHLDNHHLWDAQYPDEFAISVFQTIMDSIQNQHSYAVIQILMAHLDEKSKSQRKSFDSSSEATTRVRTGIATVLSSIIAVAAAESIGPSVLEIINSLLRHLRNSINNFQMVSINKEDEKQFQETVINALGEFANNLPDFQKIEIMIFIISKVPPSSSDSKADIRLQDILLKSLLKVSTKYRTVNISHAFPPAFLNPLLALSLAADSNVRITVQLIFQQLLDRHGNLSKLLMPVTLTEIPPLNIEKAYRQDIMFMRKHGPELLSHIYKNLQFANNTPENYNALYTTLALFCIEMSSEETLTEMLRLIFIIQDMTKNSSLTLSQSQHAEIHRLVAAFLHLIAQLTAIPALCAHVDQIIKTRNSKAAWMLPEYDSEMMETKMSEVSEDLLFNKEIISEALRNSGHDTSRLSTPLRDSGSVVDSSKAISTTDLKYVDIDVESTHSSPGIIRKQQEIERINFQDLRNFLNTALTDEQDAREERRAQILLKFKRADFADLVAKSNKNNGVLQTKLNDLFEKLPQMESPNGEVFANAIKNPIFSIQFNQCNNGYQREANDEALSEEEKRSAVAHKSPFNSPLYSLQFPDVFA
ncbi:protein EFR3 B-like protein [Dinothrombium tinctorium]|uniref:Protein EFR3 B-like protein n=1 Tax=Dinothrombium tinctorium TaxID=1965070 RepID=A0A3S3P507_9ACAR|nr:protein EFR3 B-like protein [Dinothrombium tinctorium]